MKEEVFVNMYSSNENVISGVRGAAHDESCDLTRLEILILECTKSKPKSETKISREVKINLPIVSQVITELMLKGLIERTMKRRILFYKEYFSTNLEGLIALDHSRRNDTKYTFFCQALSGFKDRSQSILVDLTSGSMSLKLIMGTVKLVCRMARYVLAE
jgi:DNA-binding MarR family transcriptional regulator